MVYCGSVWMHFAFCEAVQGSPHAGHDLTFYAIIFVL